MRFGDVALAVRLHGIHDGRDVSGLQIDQPMTKDRALNQGPAYKSNAPDFLARFRIISADHIAAGTDDLPLTIVFDELTSGKREGQCRLDRPIRLPDDIAGFLIECDDKLLIVPVAAEDDSIIDENGRAAAAVLRFAIQARFLPKDFAVEIQRSGAHVPEVNEERVSIGDRGRAGVAILAVRLLDGLGVLDKDLLLPKDSSFGSVHTESLQRIGRVFFHCRGQVKPTVVKNGR